MIWFMVACFNKPFIRPEYIAPVAEVTMNVAHPAATLIGSELVGSNNSRKGGRFVDIKMDYQPFMQAEASLTVRYYILSTDPCEIDLKVLSDTGNLPPILLNEWAAGPELSEYICSNYQN